MADAPDILDKAKDHYKVAKDAWQEIYQKARNDLHFLSDEPYAQWDAQEANNRATVGRPVLEVDQLSQFIHQVINDIRMNTPSIKVIPDGEGSDTETADIISGRIKAIEYKSNADSAYDMAAEFAVKSSIGFIRVDHDYVDSKGFNQELKIKRVINPAAVLIDPDSIEPDGSDAKYGFVLEEITKKEFERLYPEATPMSFGEDKPNKDLKDSDKITIAEYFVINESNENMGLLDNGSAEPVVKGKKYKSTRIIPKATVLRYKLSGEDELESTSFPGKYIPLIPVYGEEAWVEGKRGLKSLIRNSKSSQMAYNMLKSSETEILLKQQQAPVQAAVGQMRGFEKDWKEPEKAMVLYYHTTDVNGKDVPPPQRLQPPVVSSGFANASLDAENNIRKTLGMYNAQVGKREGNASGVALKQLDLSGDVASFHFGDNLVRSITHVGKVIVCALPEIEDTPRIVNTIGKEDEHKLVGINGSVTEDQERTYDFTTGSWDVRVTTGPSFTTQRQEAASYYAEVIKSAPDLMPVIGDLVFKYQDAPGSQAISARLKKIVDPKLLDEADREENAPDPVIQQLTMQLQQVTQEAQQQIQALQTELQSKHGDLQIKAGELQIKSQEMEIKKGELQIKLIQAQKGEPDNSAETQSQAAELAIKQKELDIKAFDAETKRMQALQKQPETQPTGIKLDTTGFQMMKTPEQESLEAEQAQQETAMEAQELQLKQADIQLREQQGQAIISVLADISSQMRQPIKIVRDEAGNMIEAA